MSAVEQGIYLLDVDAWTGSSVQTLRYSTHTLVTRGDDTPANTIYAGRIADAGRISRSIFDGGGVLGALQTSVGAIILNNQDGALDYLYDYGFDGRSFTLSELPGRGAPLSSAKTLLVGVLDGVESGDAWKEVKLRIRDVRSYLDKVLLTDRYAGTSVATGLGVEGDSDLKDQIKPYLWGSVSNIAPKVVNKYDLIYQACLNGFNSITVYDGGLALTATSDYSTQAALLASSPQPGYYATCKSAGLIKLGGSPVFEITADVVEGATLADRSAAKVARRILNLVTALGLTIDEASFSALHDFNPAEVGVYVDSDATALTILGNVLQSIGAAVIPTDDGSLKAVQITLSGTSIGTVTLRHLIGAGSFILSKGPSTEGDGIPAWSIVLNWGRVYQTMDSGQLAGAVTLSRQTFLATATRQAKAQDATMQNAHPSAAEITIDTLLTTQADAVAEATRRLALHSVRRDYPTITVPRNIFVDSAELGSIVTVDIPRFGFDGGKDFCIVGRVDDFTKRTIELTLWG